jgi:hypothetical protein
MIAPKPHLLVLLGGLVLAFSSCVSAGISETPPIPLVGDAPTNTIPEVPSTDPGIPDTDTDSDTDILPPIQVPARPPHEPPPVT